jgi:hypothetical protein
VQNELWKQSLQQLVRTTDRHCQHCRLQFLRLTTALPEPKGADLLSLITSWCWNPAVPQRAAQLTFTALALS